MNDSLMYRVLPLYSVAFFQGFVLFYVVDKWLATYVGMSATAIELAVGVIYFPAFAWH